MFLRLLAIAALAITSACAMPLAPLPKIGAPTQEAVTQAQTYCADATFVTTDPGNSGRYWFNCPSYSAAN